MTTTNREKSRLLRQQQTPAEQCLWQQLRNRQLDGIHHAEADQAEYDQIRTQFLTAQNFRVLRFWNTEIEESMPSVLDKIHLVLKTLTPQPPLPEVEGEQESTSSLSPSTSGRGVGVRVFS